MLRIKNTRVYGLEESIVRSGYPMTVEEPSDLVDHPSEKDTKRASSLGHSGIGEGHDNYLSGIIVQFDVLYPQYWTPEFQRYHFAQIISSQSKMHRLVSTLKLENAHTHFNKYVDMQVIDRVKYYVELYEAATNEEEKYHAFMKVISNLPMGYEMWMGVTSNYRQLKVIIEQRRNHKLREDWSTFCDWILELPRFRELTGI